MFKKALIIISMLLLLIGCSEKSGIVKGGISKVETELTYKGNMIKNSKDDFESGEKDGIILNDGEKLQLKDKNTNGVYTSPIILTDKFDELVASWNANTPENTNIELSLQVKIDDEWTMWYSYGKWSSNKDGRSVSNQSDKFGKMSIDTLEILYGKYADAIRYKVELSRNNENTEIPSVKSIYMTLKTKEKGISVFAEDTNYLVELDVPERSQMMVPEIGNVICSPTSLAMVLEYYGQNMQTTDVASNVLDNEVNIYGNWTYNASYAGSKGLDAYVARFESVDEIKKKISEGIPVIASIKTKSENTLVGAPQTYPSGHLIVIRGFTIKDGEEYVIVNDPASPEVENVRREYKLSGFKTAWSNMVYILSKGE